MLEIAVQHEYCRFIFTGPENVRSQSITVRFEGAKKVLAPLPALIGKIKPIILKVSQDRLRVHTASNHAQRPHRFSNFDSVNPHTLLLQSPYGILKLTCNLSGLGQFINMNRLTKCDANSTKTLREPMSIIYNRI